MRSLLVAVTSTAVVLGVISWLSPETQLGLARLVLTLLSCYCIIALIFCSGVLMLATALRVVAIAVGVVVFCYDRCKSKA